MSTDLYDLGQRLRAATLAAPVDRALYAPVLTPVDPVAVSVTGHADALVLHAATSAMAATGVGRDALGALDVVGVGLAESHRTLVVPDRATVTALTRLAAAVGRQRQHADRAAVISWWQQRADHPGSGAVLVVTEACSQRWTLGTTPTAQRSLDVWSSWLGATGAATSRLLQLAELVSTGTTLPGLDYMSGRDASSWQYHLDRLRGGWDWRTPDNRVEAALGLATREHATELYESLRLNDPLVAHGEIHAGNVVTAQLVATPAKGVLALRTDRLICRLRPGTDVRGWVGSPTDTDPLDPRADTRTTLRAALDAVTVTADGRLELILTDTVCRPRPPLPGAVITIRPPDVVTRQQEQARRSTRERFGYERNWLTGGKGPQRRTRPVPLDVMVAAASD